MVWLGAPGSKCLMTVVRVCQLVIWCHLMRLSPGVDPLPSSVVWAVGRTQFLEGHWTKGPSS